jgi:outer membrane protein OmpA-like peptidoglycan-associated protein
MAMPKAWLSPTRRDGDGDEESFVPISDLMSGLMIIFLFLAIAYMKNVTAEKERMRQVAVTWTRTQDRLYEDLNGEFRDDLPRWRADIDRRTLSVRFREPSVFFGAGSARLPDRFQEILADFFPRYLNVLRKYRGQIAEVRIEGHTSSEWNGSTDQIESYFHNMELSQNRTRAVLEYCLKLSSVSEDREWARRTITANGLSSSRPILKADGREDPDLCRRVEFRVRTDAERRIVTIIEGIETP